MMDAGNSSMKGIIGDLIISKASHRRIAVFVIGDLIRDVLGIRLNEIASRFFGRGRGVVAT